MVYSIMPGMGFRNNDAVDLAINDEPEGIYYVVDGTHYDSGCCFDYGNSSTNGRAVGTGTMETTYFGTATAWGSGNGPGPWIMADMEAGLFSGYNARQNVADPTIDSWRFCDCRRRWRWRQQVGSSRRQCTAGWTHNLLQRNSPRLDDQQQLLPDAEAGRHPSWNRWRQR
jgi:hypothetical protein